MLNMVVHTVTTGLLGLNYMTICLIVCMYPIALHARQEQPAYGKNMLT
jgi:hypothetical protein